MSSSCAGADQVEDPDEASAWLEQQLQTCAVPHCSAQSLQAALQLLNIQVLAFTPPGTWPWRVYLYTHTQYGDSGSTLVLGELLHTGEANQSAVPEGEEQPDQEQLGGNEAELKEIKVTLKQKPRDERALKGLLSILTTVLHTLSSETSD